MGALQMENIYTKISRGKYLKSFHVPNLIFVSREIHYTFCDHHFVLDQGLTHGNNLELNMNLTPPENYSFYCYAVKRTLPNVTIFCFW